MRRQSLSNSLAAVGASLLSKCGFAIEGDLVPRQIPGAIPSSQIASARFPPGFL